MANVDGPTLPKATQRFLQRSLPLGQSAVCSEKEVAPPNCFSFLGRYDHEARFNINNYFFKFFKKGLTSSNRGRARFFKDLPPSPVCAFMDLTVLLR